MSTGMLIAIGWAVSASLMTVLWLVQRARGNVVARGSVAELTDEVVKEHLTV